MSGWSPNFDDWSKLPSLKIWEAAALMHDVDPRALADYIELDLTSQESVGVAADFSWTERQIISSVEVGQIVLVRSDQAEVDRYSEITMVSYRYWLRSIGRSPLADSLDGPGSDQRSTGAIAVRIPAVQKMRTDILEALVRLSYDPQRLPPRIRNEPGVKAEVREQLFPEEAERKRNRKTFDTAWQSLRDMNLIAEIE